MTYTVAKGNQLVDPDQVPPVDGAVDLRSDTVTRPSDEMRRAMASAEVGDDVYGEDPTVNQLQKRAAEIFDKEAALFVPTGCMGNLISIKSGPITATKSSAKSAAMSISTSSPPCPRSPDACRGGARGDDGIITWKQIEAVIRPKIYYDSQTALVCLENSSNMAGGTVYPTERVNEICARPTPWPESPSRRRAHLQRRCCLGENVANMTNKVDSVMFCLSKGLGAPVGSMIVGSKEFIERARIYRKMFGGGCARSASSPRPV